MAPGTGVLYNFFGQLTKLFGVLLALCVPFLTEKRLENAQPQADDAEGAENDVRNQQIVPKQGSIQAGHAVVITGVHGQVQAEDQITNAAHQKQHDAEGMLLHFCASLSLQFRFLSSQCCKQPSASVYLRFRFLCPCTCHSYNGPECSYRSVHKNALCTPDYYMHCSQGVQQIGE